MFAPFFQWTLHPGREQDFVKIWNEGTALARWPDVATRDAAFDRVRDHSVFVRMRECVAETMRWDDTTEISNMWKLP